MTPIDRSIVNMLKWGYSNGPKTCDCGTRQTMEHLLACFMMETACSTQDLTMANAVAIDCTRHWEGTIWHRRATDGSTRMMLMSWLSDHLLSPAPWRTLCISRCLPDQLSVVDVFANSIKRHLHKHPKSRLHYQWEIGRTWCGSPSVLANYVYTEGSEIINICTLAALMLHACTCWLHLYFGCPDAARLHMLATFVLWLPWCCTPAHVGYICYDDDG